MRERERLPLFVVWFWREREREARVLARQRRGIARFMKRRDVHAKDIKGSGFRDERRRMGWEGIPTSHGKPIWPNHIHRPKSYGCLGWIQIVKFSTGSGFCTLQNVNRILEGCAKINMKLIFSLPESTHIDFCAVFKSAVNNLGSVKNHSPS